MPASRGPGFTLPVLPALAAGILAGTLALLAGCSSGQAAGPSPAGSSSPAAATPSGGAGTAAIARPGPPPAGLDAVTPAQLQTAYDVLPLLRRGIDGRGQSIVIVDPFGSPSIQHDLAVFDRQFGLPAPPSLRVIQPAGPVPPYRSSSGRAGAAAETTLDVEAAHLMAPGAGIVLAETPVAENEGATGFAQIVTAVDYVIRHHLGGVISQSFGATEQTFSAAARLRGLRGDYRLAAAQHITVLASTGDTGAAGYTYSMQGVFPSPAVGWPASDPLVTAVGGTQLDLTPAGARLHPDVAWDDSGGGRSAVFTQPSWQRGVAAQARGRRAIPDISMDASCNSALAVYGVGQQPGAAPGWFTACGTSLSAPLLAGLIALAGQEAGHPLGVINPALYRMAAAHDPALVDVRSGGNRFPVSGGPAVAGFRARPGYDLVTGLGTVDAARFVPDLARLAG